MLPNLSNYIETGCPRDEWHLNEVIVLYHLWFSLHRFTSRYQLFFGGLKIWTCALRIKEKKHEDVTISSVAANASRSKVAAQATGAGFSLTLRPVTLVQFLFNLLLWGNEVMDSALASWTGGPGSIPASGKASCNIQMVFLPLGPPFVVGQWNGVRNYLLDLVSPCSIIINIALAIPKLALESLGWQNAPVIFERNILAWQLIESMKSLEINLFIFDLVWTWTNSDVESNRPRFFWVQILRSQN